MRNGINNNTQPAYKHRASTAPKVCCTQTDGFKLEPKRGIKAYQGKWAGRLFCHETLSVSLGLGSGWLQLIILQRHFIRCACSIHIYASYICMSELLHYYSIILSSANMYIMNRVTQPQSFQGSQFRVATIR